MKKEQVLVLYRNPLFGEGLSSLLKRERSLEVVGVVEKVVEKKEIPWKKAGSVCPDVVIIEGKDLVREAGSALVELLKCCAKARVISVSSEDQDAVLCIGLRLAATEPNLIRAIKTRIEEEAFAHGPLAWSVKARRSGINGPFGE